ncbi:MAG: hypothetical protein GY820_21405 [Gammaproteobacteria bacterium]|nr:hypothetical protein [Gammaproteobacteria bacterium]
MASDFREVSEIVNHVVEIVEMAESIPQIEMADGMVNLESLNLMRLHNSIVFPTELLSGGKEE